MSVRVPEKHSRHKLMGHTSHHSKGFGAAKVENAYHSSTKLLVCIGCLLKLLSVPQAGAWSNKMAI